LFLIPVIIIQRHGEMFDSSYFDNLNKKPTVLNSD
jgi:hypothetical protein